MESISPQLDNSHYDEEKVLEHCVNRGCQKNGTFKVLLKYIKRSAYLCDNCIDEFRNLGFIALEYVTLEGGET